MTDVTVKIPLGLAKSFVEEGLCAVTVQKLVEKALPVEYEVGTIARVKEYGTTYMAEWDGEFWVTSFYESGNREGWVCKPEKVEVLSVPETSLREKVDEALVRLELKVGEARKEARLTDYLRGRHAGLDSAFELLKDTIRK